METQTRLAMETKQFPRIQSPSSINIYRQCPRKYYYKYHLKLPTLPSINLLRGNIVHSAMEDFFKINAKQIAGKEFLFTLKIILYEALKRNWNLKKNELSGLGLPQEELNQYYEESISMLENWFKAFSEKLNLLSIEFGEEKAFEMLKPKVEQEYVSEKYGVRGFIDALHENDKIKIIDYKTSAKDTITPEYRLQLAIYAMLYEEKHGRKPDFVGISFMKFGDRMIEVDDGLIEFAKNEVLSMHINTASDNIRDYPKNENPLCKWANGQCDFYEKCFKD